MDHPYRSDPNTRPGQPKVSRWQWLRCFLGAHIPYILVEKNWKTRIVQLIPTPYDSWERAEIDVVKDVFECRCGKRIYDGPKNTHDSHHDVSGVNGTGG